MSSFGGPAWTWNEDRGQYYLHHYSPRQPDLNYRNPNVVREMKVSTDHWIWFCKCCNFVLVSGGVPSHQKGSNVMKLRSTTQLKSAYLTGGPQTSSSPRTPVTKPVNNLTICTCLLQTRAFSSLRMICKRNRDSDIFYCLTFKW